MRLLRRPWPWLAAFIAWFCVMWWLSSRALDMPQGLGFRGADKVLHFGWFLGGAGLLSAAVFFFRKGLPARTRIAVVVAVVTLAGVVDEAHQTNTPGRRGNDPWDLTADFLGALAGAFIFQRTKHLLTGADDAG